MVIASVSFFSAPAMSRVGALASVSASVIRRLASVIWPLMLLSVLTPGRVVSISVLAVVRCACHGAKAMILGKTPSSRAIAASSFVRAVAKFGGALPASVAASAAGVSAAAMAAAKPPVVSRVTTFARMSAKTFCAAAKSAAIPSSAAVFLRPPSASCASAAALASACRLSASTMLATAAV